MKRDERGYIVVETIGCFLLFVFLNVSILSLINITTVQARVHYALTQAAQTISMYSYTLEVLGVADHLVENSNVTEGVVTDTNTLVKNINDVLDELENLNLEGAVEAGKDTYNQVNGIVTEAVNDPMSVLRTFMNVGLNQGLSVGIGEIARSLVGRYLSNGEVSGDQFLRAFQVIDGLNGLDFYCLDAVGYDPESGRLTPIKGNDSVFLDSSENIKLVVQYDIDYTFGALPLPFGKLHITQEVTTKAWLNGVGDGYKRK